MSFVNIVTSDRGWILEKLARETAERLPYVAFGTAPRGDAAIQYYVTYSSRRRRVSPIEVAYFAHLEPHGDAHDSFFAVARDVEHCVCHASLYAAALRDAGVEHVTTIPPGVDLEAFRPKLRIGVVGRTYHTGRKGEHIVHQVMDIPEIEWSFTGEGWPLPGLDLPAEALPDHYRGLDYVLVPSLYEGGPMCVAEALACGTEVIAPPVGWVPEHPHIEYRVGDAADLRRVLLGLVAKKRALRAAVLGRGWDAWAEAHDRLFQALAAGQGVTLRRPPRKPRPVLPQRVGLLLHGNERESQGGPSVRVPRLARELGEHGIEATPLHHPASFDGLDLVHVFNSWPPWSAPDALRRAHRSGAAVVFSPILLDHGLGDLWGDRLPRLFAEAEPGEATDAALAAFRAELAARRAGETPPVEPAAGFQAAMREMAALSDRLVLVSEAERARLARIGAETRHGVVVRNPVDATRFAGADPALFRNATGLRDFVLCVARLEPRKNQAMLVHALRGTGLPLVLLGHATDAAYGAALERHRTAEMHLLDRLDPDSPLLASAFAAARVAVLPSWAEGAPLAALEAAAAGAALVLSGESGEREYLGDHARYADPGDPAALRRAVLEAWDTQRSAGTIAAQKAFIAETYGWDGHRSATETVYAEALAAARTRGAPQPLRAAPALPKRRRVQIVFDVTTGANHHGRWTGIARVEAALAIALGENPQAELCLIAWNNVARAFVEMPFHAIRDGTLPEMLARHDSDPAPLPPMPEGAHLLVAGSAWMQNALYAESIVAFARCHRLRLTPLIHDVIPTRFPFWYDEGYAPVFEHNLTLLLDGAEALIAVSEATRRDVEAFAARTPNLFIPDIAVLREGDEIGDADAASPIARAFNDRPFVLCVGAIHARKNQRLLHDVWLKLVQRMGPRCPQLVLVGGVAWNGRDVARGLREDARLEGRVTILEDVDDAALAWLYRHCLFTAYPSLHEGWGLPVAESLRHGKLCLAADVASIPEIAPGLVELLDPLDVTLWTARVQFYAGSAAARQVAEARIAETYQPFGWSQSAMQLLRLLAAAERRPRPARPYTLGAIIPFGDRITASRVRWEGWHAFESWGCWAAATRSALRFDPTTPCAETLVLLADVRALPMPGATFDVDVLANGTHVARWRIGSGGFQLFHALIPSGLATPVHVEFVCDALTAVREVSGTDDPRRIGIGLGSVALAPASAVPDAGRYFEMQRPLPNAIRLAYRHNLLRQPEGRAFLTGAWRHASAWGMCAAGNRSLSLPTLAWPGCDLDLELRLRPVASPDYPLHLAVVANGEAVGAFSFDSADPRDIRVRLRPALRARASPLTVDLVATEAHAPSALGLGASDEAFGFGLLSIELRRPGAPRATERITLRPDGMQPLVASEAAIAGALEADWHAPEPSATWSFGRVARLPLRLEGDHAAGALLQADIGTYRAAPDETDVKLVVNAGGRPILECRCAARQAATIRIPIPPDCIGTAGEVDLAFAVDDAPSPFVAGDGADERPLGLRVAAIGWVHM